MKSRADIKKIQDPKEVKKVKRYKRDVIGKIETEFAKIVEWYTRIEAGSDEEIYIRELVAEWAEARANGQLFNGGDEEQIFYSHSQNY